MVKFIGGRAGSSLSDRLLSLVKERAKHDKKIILIVPEQFTVMQERELLDTLGNSTADGIEVLSFGRLCPFILTKTGGIARNYISDSGRFLLMHKAYEAVLQNLKVYRRISNYTDFINKLLQLCDEFRTYNISLDDVNELFGEKNDSLSSKMQDLSLIFAAYRAMAEKDFADKIDDINVAAKALENDRIFDGYAFYFAEFKGFSPQQRIIIEEILKQADQAYFFLTTDDFYDRDDLSLFHAAAETVHEISKICEKIGQGKPEVELLSSDNKIYSPEISHIEKNIYKTEPLIYEDEVQNVEIVCAGTEFEELEFVASDIQKKIIELGYRYKDFAVITRNLDRYINVIDSVFTRCGIPVFLDRTTDVLSKPLAVLIFSAFDCVIYGYKYKDVMSYLKSGITGMTLDDIDKIDNYAFQWGIKGSAWKRDWKRHPKGFGKEFRDEDRAELDNLNNLRKKAVKQLVIFEKSLTTDNTKDIAKAVFDMLISLGVPENIERIVERLSDDDRPYEAAQYEQLWDKIAESLDQIVMICGESMKPAKFAKLFRQMLSGVDIGVIPTAVDEVFAGSAERMRAGDIKCAYIIGFNAGEFPQGSFGEGLISDAEKRKLQENDIMLSPSAQQRAFDERFFVYTALTSAKEKLIITYPQSDGIGESKKRSYIVTMLQNIMPALKERFLDDEKSETEINNHYDAVEYIASHSGDVPGYLKAGLLDSKEVDFAMMLKKMAGADKKRLKLANEESVKGIFATENVSPTKLETYAKCPFMYFCKYGLKLNKRKEYAIDNLEIGTFMHSVIEKFVRETKDFTSVDVKSRVHELVQEYLIAEIGDIEQLPNRTKAVFMRMEEELCGFLSILKDEFKDSKFVPAAFELGIGTDVRPLEISDASFVEGRIDRVDRYDAGDSVYLRVADYKTSEKRLSLSHLYHGMDMQMLLYLFALKENGKDYFGKNVKVAGVIYTPVKYGYVAVDSRHDDIDSIIKSHFKDSQCDGLIVNDDGIIHAMDASGEFKMLPISYKKDGTLNANSLNHVATEEQFDSLEKYVISCANEIVKKIKSGDIGIKPYYDESDREKYISCKYCDMRAVCRYERNGSCDREIEHISTGEFWERISEG